MYWSGACQFFIEKLTLQWLIGAKKKFDVVVKMFRISVHNNKKSTLGGLELLTLLGDWTCPSR